MRVKKLILALLLLTACKPHRGVIVERNYDQGQLLSYLAHGFEHADGFKQIECDSANPEGKYQYCLLTNKYLTDLDSILKKFEDDGLSLLKDWENTGSTTDNRGVAPCIVE